jgi:hypothetical protein
MLPTLLATGLTFETILLIELALHVRSFISLSMSPNYAFGVTHPIEYS